MAKKEIKYIDYTSTGEISIERTASGKWRFESESMDNLTRGDLYKIRNLFEDILVEQEKEEEWATVLHFPRAKKSIR